MRVLLLPQEWEGKRTIRYVDPGDEEKPKLQRPTVFFDRSITLAVTRGGCRCPVASRSPITERHGSPTVARSYASTVINASPDDVWARIRNFNDLPTWAGPAIEKSELKGGLAGDQVGAIRHSHTRR